MIYVLDARDWNRVVAHIDVDDIEGSYSQGLDGENTLRLSIPSTHKARPHIKDFCRFVRRNRRGYWQEYVAWKITEKSGGRFMEVLANGAEQEIDTLKIMHAGKYEAETLAELAQRVVGGTGYELGMVDFASYQTETIENAVGGYAFLKRLGNYFERELRFRIEVSGTKVLGRYVDILERIGRNNPRIISFGDNLAELERIIHTDRIVTKLECRGPERDEGERLTAEIVDEDAFARWNLNGKHRVDYYEPSTTDSDMTQERLEQLGRMELKKRNDRAVEYILSVAVFPGDDYALGDTNRIEDTSFNPTLYAESRIIHESGPLSFSSDDVTEIQFKFGEVEEFSAEDLRAEFKRLQELYATKIIRQPEKPPLRKNAIWIQTDPTNPSGFEISHTADMELGDWVRTTAIYPFEIGAEPEIPEGSTPPDPAITKKWVDTSGEIAELKMWDGAAWVSVRGPKGEDGYTPVKGTDYFDGKDGQDGRDGTSAFMWIRYSQYADGSFMTDDPTGPRYIGVATTETASAPTANSSYQWTLIRGSDGVPGEPGEDGRSSFLHIKYSNDGGSTFTANNGETAGEYIGQYVDFTEQDSSNPADYTWNRVKGEQGEQGPNIVDSTTQIEANVVKANHIDVANLSAIKANLGEVTAGIFRNATNSNVINMDTGLINFGNGKFVVQDGNVTFSGALNGATGTFTGEVNIGGLNDLGEGQKTVISGGRFYQETANNRLKMDAHSIRLDSLNSLSDERFTFWNNSGIAFNTVDANVQHSVNYGVNVVNDIAYGRINSKNEFTIDTDDVITFATNGGTDTFEFSNVESFRHALMKFGKGALKSLNGSISGVQVRNAADTAFISLQASNVEVASDRKFKKNIEKFEGTALWDVLNTPAHTYHLVEQEDDEPKVIGLIADESPEVMRVRDESGDRISLYAQNTLLWKAMQELFELLVDTKAVNLNKVKKGKKKG